MELPRIDGVLFAISERRSTASGWQKAASDGLSLNIPSEIGMPNASKARNALLLAVEA
jgi:hypothetical protein